MRDRAGWQRERRILVLAPCSPPQLAHHHVRDAQLLQLVQGTNAADV